MAGGPNRRDDPGDLEESGGAGRQPSTTQQRKACVGEDSSGCQVSGVVTTVGMPPDATAVYEDRPRPVLLTHQRM
jgi:hypothetical protein